MKEKERRHHGIGKGFARDTAGFSLVEIIIVIAVLTILTGSTVSLAGHVRYADTKKTAKQIYSVLRSQQVNSMSGSDDQAIYIYKLGGDYYMRVAAASVADADLGGVLTSAGMKIANSNVTIQGLTMTDGTVTGTYSVNGNSSTGGSSPNCIKVVYKRSGVFNDAGTNADAIKVVGKSEHTITLVRKTGKCVFE